VFLKKRFFDFKWLSQKNSNYIRKLRFFFDLAHSQVPKCHQNFRLILFKKNLRAPLVLADANQGRASQKE
jgi:hypothetical protein